MTDPLLSCAYCNSIRIVQLFGPGYFEYQGSLAKLAIAETSVCLACGNKFTTEEQAQRNKAKIDAFIINEEFKE